MHKPHSPCTHLHLELSRTPQYQPLVVSPLETSPIPRDSPDPWSLQQVSGTPLDHSVGSQLLPWSCLQRIPPAGARFRFCFLTAAGFREREGGPGGLPGRRLSAGKRGAGSPAPGLSAKGRSRQDFPARSPPMTPQWGRAGKAGAGVLRTGGDRGGPGRAEASRGGAEPQRSPGEQPPGEAARSAPRVRQVRGEPGRGRAGRVSAAPPPPRPRVRCLRGRERVFLRPAGPSCARGRGRRPVPELSPARGEGLAAAGAPAWRCRDRVLPWGVRGTRRRLPAPSRALPP